MNSKQRSKDKKQKALIKAGIQAQELIQAAEVEAELWKGQFKHSVAEARELDGKLVETKSAVSRLMQNANSFSEAVASIEKEHKRQLDALSAQHEEQISFVEEQNRLDTAMMVSQHEADVAILKEQVGRLKSQVAEPNKLRERLRKKELKNQELQFELNKLKQRIVAASILHPFADDETVDQAAS